MKETSFFVMGVGDIFPTSIDLKDHLMLLHVLVLVHILVHILDLELDFFPILQQVVWESISFVLPYHF